MNKNLRKWLPSTISLATLLVLSPVAAEEGNREQARVNFEKADVNKDMKLDRTEFKAFIDLYAQLGLGRASQIRRFGAYDKAFAKIDADGTDSSLKRK